ncbi:MAG: adenine phosphoribosyltransferase [Thermoplasmata archaeon]|nr:adenine phosphoribosyltransferase [Thermoplasmata archaeon]
MPAPSTYRATVGSQQVDLPLVPVGDDLLIALLITVDLGLSFADQAGRELAAELAPLSPEVVASVATMGIPLAIEVSRSLGLDDYVILHKTPKIHLGDTYSEPVRSITTVSRQTLRMDPARVPSVRGRRVVVVDDIVSTGASMSAALALIRRAGGTPVAIGTLMTEGSAWREALGEDAALVRALGALPVFRPDASGGVQPDWS